MNNQFTHDEYAQQADFDEAELRRIDLNLLVVFAMVVRHGSVQAAASRLYLGSSGVSMALNRLRSITADPLFVRGKRGLEPTAFGREFYDRVSPALTSIGDAMHRRSFDPEQAVGHVRLALSEDVEIVLAAQLTKELADHAPGLNLIVRHGDYQRAAAILDDDVADVVVTAKPAECGARHRSETLMRETFVILSDGGRFVPTAAISIDDYLSASHALVSASGAARGRIDELLNDLGLNRTIKVVTESFAALPFLLRSSDLIANVPRMAGHALAAAYGLAVHELPVPSPSFPLAMTWRVRDEEDARFRWIRSTIRQQFAGAAGSAVSPAMESRDDTEPARRKKHGSPARAL